MICLIYIFNVNIKNVNFKNIKIRNKDVNKDKTIKICNTEMRNIPIPSGQSSVDCPVKKLFKMLSFFFLCLYFFINKLSFMWTVFKIILNDKWVCALSYAIIQHTNFCFQMIYFLFFTYSLETYLCFETEISLLKVVCLCSYT